MIELGKNSIDISWSAGSDCDTLKKKLEADGVLESRNGYAVAKNHKQHHLQ